MIETDRPTPDLPAVEAAYTAWAAAYIERFASADLAEPEDRALIGSWADCVRGPILDAGCGPGHWSAFLRARGCDVAGVDATAAFIAHATRTHPAIDFHVADLRSLSLTSASLGGVLAWFSLIHTDPSEVEAALTRFTDALRPGGLLLLGFFGGDRLAPFEHRVVTAWAWPLTDMIAAVEHAGLEITHAEERPALNGRVNAALIARRPFPPAD